MADRPVDLKQVVEAFAAALAESAELSDTQRADLLSSFRDQIAMVGEHYPDEMLPTARQVIENLKRLGEGG